MSNTPVLEPPAQRLSSGSVQTLTSRPLQPISDPSASKRVCFYKSGDYKFSGHRMVINARTFKTFDALLDALSKKVPLPFGVRTITTPRGTHLVKGLDDLHDGGCYVCSDQKRVKPLNLDEVNRRQVPWNTTRPLSARRRRRHQGVQFGRRTDVNNSPAKVTERVAVRTPKRLVVIKNKDPTVKRTIVLQRRIAPTFDALLDYLSQILRFPVLKLYSTDGRRVDGLAALILCSGVVVAAGNEPFRLGNYSFHRTGQMAQVMYMETVEPSLLQPRAQNKSLSSGRGSRNFSLSSERYIVNQINKSQNGSMNSHYHSFESEVNPHHTSMATSETGRVDTEHHTCIVPQDDDIEKSFRVNQDGSMTVEMKVRLTIKEEEMLHWTTTLSRSSLSKGTVCASISESGNSSPNSNNAIAKDASSISEDETKEENHSAGAGKGVGFNDERVCESYTSTALGKGKTSFKRMPTPGPQYVKKKASVESVKMVTESGVHENTLGHYSYMERTADGESAKGYCVIRHNSSSNRPIPKPRKTPSAGTNKKDSHSSIRSSGVAEVLQIQNSGMEVTETVLHIYESQGCYDNYFANEEYSTDGVPFHDSPAVPDTKPSTASELRSSSNDIDFSWQPPTADSLQRQKEEMLSLSSEPISSAHKIMNDLSSVTENEAHTATPSQTEETVKTHKTPKSEKNKKMTKPASNHKSSTSSSDKKQKKNIGPSKNSKHSTDKQSSNASVGKKSLSSSESAKNGQRSKGAEMKPEKPQSKKLIKDEKMPIKDSVLLVSTGNVKRTPPKRSMNKAAAKDNGHNVNTLSGRPQMKKNMSDILQPKKTVLPVRKTVSKPKSMTENRLQSPKQTLQLNESVSMPSLNPTPSEVHQYVENWLEKVSPDQVPSTEEALPDELEPRTKVVFQIGGDSEIEENNESQANLDEYYSQPVDALKKSASCLSVPLCHDGPATSLLHTEQKSRGLCVSMPSVRIDPVLQENRLRAHKSAEDIGPADNESSSSNILSPRAKIKPVLRQLCSSIQCIRRVSDTNTTSNLEKSNSLPDFSTQVALVFGSSCKAFLSFLSVMTLRDSLTPAPGDDHQSRNTSEAMIMMESLQKISAMDDEKELRASLTDLQSRASSQFRERWKDFQILRERLESEPLSPRVSETEFALDVVSEGGDAFEDQHLGINELMDELNMPQDLREEISSTIQHARPFYPVEESTFVETEKNQSDSEEEVEQFVEECNGEGKSELNSTCIGDDIREKKQHNDDEIDDLNKMQKLAKTMCEVEQAESDVKDSEISQIETDEPLNHNESEPKDKKDQVVKNSKEEKEDPKEINDVDGEELEKIEKEREEETEDEEEAVKKNAKEVDEWGSGEESVEKEEEGTEEDRTVDGEEEQWKELEGGKEVVEETEDGTSDLEDQETRHSNSAEETEEEEKGEEGGDEEMQVKEIEEETDEVAEGTDEEQEVENIEEQEEEERGVEGEDAQVAQENDVEEEVEETIEEADEGEEEENIENEEEAETLTENDAEEDVEEVTEETEEEDEEQNIIKVGEKEEEEVVNEASEGDVEEEEEVAEDTDEEKQVVNIIEEVDQEGGEEEVDVFIEEADDGEEEENIEEKEEEAETLTENDAEEEVDVFIEEADEGEEEENIEEKEEEAETLTENDAEEDMEEVIEETEEDDEEQNIIEEVGEKVEEEEVNEVSEGDVAEEEEVAEETDEEKQVVNIIEEVDQEGGEEEVDVFIEEADDGEEEENIEEKEEEAETLTENDAEEDMEEVIEETEEDDEEQNIIEEVGEKVEEEEVNEVSEGDVAEEEEVAEETDEEKQVVNIIEEVDQEGGEEEVDVFIEEADDGEEEENIEEKEEEAETLTENDAEEEVDVFIEEADEGEEEENIEEKEEEAETLTENDAEEDMEEDIEETEEDDEEQNIIEEVGEKVEEEVNEVSEGDVAEEEEVAEETDEEKRVVNIIKEVDEKGREEEMYMVIEERTKEEDETEVVTEENNDKEDKEEEKRGQEEDHNVEEGGETGRDTEEDQKREAVEETESEESMKAGQMLEEGEMEDYEENWENEGLEPVEKQEVKDEVEGGTVTEEESFIDAEDCKNLLDSVSYLQQQCGSYVEANVGQNSESPTKYSSDVQCEDDKGNGTDTVNELETDDGGENHEERLRSQPHPMEISQELLDFVNSALQSSSLTFIYDSRGNIRIEPDNARVIQTNQVVIPNSSNDSLYRLNCLPSPRTSDLSDYRPETSESGGYKTQDSVDIVTDSGEEASDKPFPVYRHKTDIPNGRTNVERLKSKMSVASNSEILESSRLKSADNFYDSGSKASREDLSYFSAASSLKADAEAAPEAAQCISSNSEKDSTDGVLIDQGRWLLKENHLIRKSPPVSLGMYGNLDSTSIDTSQENTSEHSPPHYKTQHNPLAAISSSELEEMAKPLTPKCTYYNMPHGSDSDPFLDDSSVRSGKKDTSSFKGRGSRVSPTIDTSRTWPNKNGSLSSFASVEFKMPDRKVHPEGESSVVAQTGRTSSGTGSVLQSQDSLDTLHVRCSQFCPIL